MREVKLDRRDVLVAITARIVEGSLRHGFAGVVTAAGEQNEALVGKRVTAIGYQGCEICEYCRQGRENLCSRKRWLDDEGTEKVVIPGQLVYPVEDDVTDREAAALAFAAVAYSGIRKVEEILGEDVMILGHGAVSLMMVQLAKLAGAGQVFYGTDSSACGQIALQMGAYMIGEPDEEWCRGVREKTGGQGVKYVFDGMGSENTQKFSLKVLKQRGTLINMVENANAVSIQLLDLNGEKAITSSTGSPHKDHRSAFRLISTHQLDLTPLLENEVSWEKEMLDQI